VAGHSPEIASESSPATDQSKSLTELAERVVERARRAGADVAEAVARSGWELSARVRLGEPELVEEAGSRGISLKVIRDQRVALTATSDLSEDGLERLISDALELSELSEPDPFDGPADASQLLQGPAADLDLYDDGMDSVDADDAIDRATRAERAALDFDDRLSLSEGATFGRRTSTSAMVLSCGFSRVQRGSYASLVVSPVAMDADDKRRRGFYWTGNRHLEDLDDGEEVGREAARRTLAQLGARKVPTCEAPVIFSADAARSILGTFAGCITGSAIWRESSYLMSREGTEVANPLVTIVDDPTIPRAPGSRPFDGEGLESRVNRIVEDGVLKTYLLDCYSARKLGKASTASASRGGASVGPSTSNFMLLPGKMTKEELVGASDGALYVTEMMGFGFNAVTGDFSRGASGFWIEKGKRVQPVSEVTISSNLDVMLKTIDAVADDLELKASTASPTFRVASMTIGGS
jgi:PmbA protein